MKVELGKKYKTRDGKEVRVYATDHPGDYCVVGAVLEQGHWNSRTWRDCGSYWDHKSESELDLILDEPEELVPFDSINDYVADPRWVSYQGGDPVSILVPMIYRSTSLIIHYAEGGAREVSFREANQMGFKYSDSIKGPWHPFTKPKK